MEIQVPQSVDVRRLEAAHLQPLETSGRTLGPLRLPARSRAHPGQTVPLHVATHRRVGRQGAERWIGLDPRRQVVVVQLVAPAEVLRVLGL